MNPFSLDGKIAVVTGASRGIGKAIAVGLAQAGADVIGVSRNLSDLESVKSLILEAGRKGAAVEADVSNTEEIESMVEECIRTFGTIDILVNNAGLSIRREILHASEDDYHGVMNLNFKGALFCAQRVAKEMVKRRKGGRIVNIASIGGEVAFSERGVYRASKAALIHLTKTMALEWVQYGIHVNAIGPGYFHTPAMKGIRESNRDVYQYIADRTAMKRWGEPEELVGAAVFLSSDASSYMTGQTIFIDGGLLIKQ